MCPCSEPQGEKLLSKTPITVIVAVVVVVVAVVFKMSTRVRFLHVHEYCSPS